MTVTEADVGLMVTLLTVGVVTVTVAVPALPVAVWVKVMVVEPVLRAVTLPTLSTLATVASLDDQVPGAVGRAPLLASRKVAVSVLVCATVRALVVGVTST